MLVAPNDPGQIVVICFLIKFSCAHAIAANVAAWPSAYRAMAILGACVRHMLQWRSHCHACPDHCRVPITNLILDGSPALAPACHPHCSMQAAHWAEQHAQSKMQSSDGEGVAAVYEAAWRGPEPLCNLTDGMVQCRSSWAAESQEVKTQKECAILDHPFSSLWRPCSNVWHFLHAANTVNTAQHLRSVRCTCRTRTLPGPPEVTHREMRYRRFSSNCAATYKRCHWQVQAVFPFHGGPAV
jgi:hypothetical protein